jgi:hypothetical protein
MICQVFEVGDSVSSRHLLGSVASKKDDEI